MLEDPDTSSNGNTEIERGQTLTEGISYEEYLLLLMMGQSEKKSIDRMIDVIEMDVRKLTKKEQFRMNNCADAMKLEASIANSHGTKVELERVYWYQ